MTLTQTCEQSPQVRQMMEVRQLIHQEREWAQDLDVRYFRLKDLQKNIQSRLKQMGCRCVPWKIRFERRSITVLLLAFVVVGCASKPIPTTQRPAQRTVNALTPPMPTTTAASGQAVSAPKGETVLLAWDRSPSPEVQGYRLWYGPKSSVYTNSVDVGQVTGAALTNLMLPQFVAATAYNAEGLQSPFSNEVQVRGWDTVVRINALTNTALNTNFVFSHTIFTATNPPDGFWKLEAVRTVQAR